MKQYITHDNGAQPFTVKINKNDVIIYKNKYNGDDFIIDKEVMKFKFIKKYIGDEFGEFAGNSLLFRLSEIDYLYIGNEIYFICWK